MANAALPKKACEQLLVVLEKRFQAHPHRHQGIDWPSVETRLRADPRALWSLNQMERTSGEPDVIGRDPSGSAYQFCDCSPQSPEGRRNVCYDPPGQLKREKEGLTLTGNVLAMAAAMRIEPLNEEQYRRLQTLGEFDTRTQSWLKTPDEIYRLGGAIFADRRFGRVFVYHNTAPCFYRARGFRGLLHV